jgi:hypothetical protein
MTTPRYRAFPLALGSNDRSRALGSEDVRNSRAPVVRREPRGSISPKRVTRTETLELALLGHLLLNDSLIENVPLALLSEEAAILLHVIAEVPAAARVDLPIVAEISMRFE